VLFVYNQLSFWAATVGTNIFKDVPVIGPLMLSFLRGGLEVTSNALTRFFTIHISVLPTLMVALLAVHIVLLRLYGISDLDPEDKRRISFFPDHILTEIIIGFYLIMILTSLAILFPPPLGELADPANTPLHIKPEWYFYPIYRWLRVVPGVIGLIGLGLFLLVLTFWPAVDALRSRWFPKRDLSVILGSLVVVVAAMVWEAFVV
jgi:quinol-cytochrome oxidoreductase complex cytochrome b subunit